MDSLIEKLCDNEKISLATNSLHFVFKKIAQIEEQPFSDGFFIVVKNKGTLETDYTIHEEDNILFEDWLTATMIFKIDENKKITVVKD